MSARATARPARTSTARLHVSSHRLRVVSLGIAASVLVLVARLAMVQVLDGAKYAAYQQSETEQQVTLTALRGAIYDRSGALLAASVPRYDVIADDFLISHPGKVAADLAPLLHRSAVQLAVSLSERSGYVVLARQIGSATETAVTNLGINGISFQTDDTRVNAGGSLFQPLLGSVNAAGNGDAALEYQYNDLLAGSPGTELVSEAPSGLVLPSGSREIRAARPGTSLVLSVDEPLQVEVTKDLTAQMLATHAASALAVIAEVHTGDVLAMVDLMRGPKGSVVPAPSNGAVASIYQPGSVMKLATISFALQDGLITPNTVFTVPYSINVGGYTFQDADVHPTEQMTVSQILAQSSNVGTIEIARLLGMQRLAQALHAFGFGQLTGLNWPGESPGIIGSPSSWYGSATAAVPIGTGVAVTPLQILDAFNAVANGGMFVPPSLVAGTITGNNPERLAPRPKLRRVLSPASVQALVPMLEGVVQDGTAVLAHIPGYTVAGKTGTAQVPSSTGLGYVPGDWNATFVGFVPAQSPQLSGIVVFNHPTPIYGGSVSAPVFAQIMQYALRHFDIAPPASTPGGAPTSLTPPRPVSPTAGTPTAAARAAIGAAGVFTTGAKPTPASSTGALTGATGSR